MHPFSASFHARDQALQTAAFPGTPAAPTMNLSNTGVCLDPLPAVSLFQHDDVGCAQPAANVKTNPAASPGSSRSSSSGASGSGPALRSLRPNNTSGQLAATSKKERTRLIHKRFRQRKKERMNSMQQELHKIQEHVQVLADANDTIQAKSVVLTGLLQCIEEQAAFMAKYQQACKPNPPPELLELARLSASSQDMTNEDHINGRRLYVAQVMPLLAEAERDPNGPAMAKIKQCNQQQRDFCKVMSSMEPEPPHIKAAFLNAMGLSGEVAAANDVQLMFDPDATDHHIWGQVVALLDLTPSQVCMALAMRELMVASLQKLNSEQQSLAALHNRLLAMNAAKKTTTTTRGAPAGAELLLDPDDTAVALQLQRNMQKQKQTHVIMFWYLMDHLLDDLQYARLWVHCFPSIPFALSIVNVVASEQAAAKLADS